MTVPTIPKIIKITKLVDTWISVNPKGFRIKLQCVIKVTKLPKFIEEEIKKLIKLVFPPIYKRKLFKEAHCFVNAFYSGNISGLDCINDKVRIRQRAEKIK